MMQSFTIFQSSDFLRFKQIVLNYCQQMHYESLHLTDQEIMQLSWHLQSNIVTPEARNRSLQAPLHFEIERSLSRLYSFELLRRGDEAAYQAFIQDQNKMRTLSWAAFKSLVSDAQSLDADQYAVIRASCFLTISDTAKRVFLANRLQLSTDSEEFLSDFAKLAPQYQLLMPITSKMTAEQLKLLEKIYWPNMHFRHMLYTEGANNMTKTFKEGVEQELFSFQDFQMWQWRWLTNLFGFQGGKAAKYYDQTVHELSQQVFAGLKHCLTNNDNFLDVYLHARAAQAGLDQNFLKIQEQELLSHMLCYFHQAQCDQTTLGKQILAGYKRYVTEQAIQTNLANLYAQYRKHDTYLTPTYVPAIVNNVYYLLKTEHHLDEEQSIQNAVHFVCQVLEQFYQSSFQNKLSCFVASKVETLKPILASWLSDRHSLRIDLQGNQLMIAAPPVPEASRSMRL